MEQNFSYIHYIHNYPNHFFCWLDMDCFADKVYLWINPDQKLENILPESLRRFISKETVEKLLIGLNFKEKLEFKSILNNIGFIDGCYDVYGININSLDAIIEVKKLQKGNQDA